MQTIDKIASILDVLSAEPELNASEIAERINLPVPTTHRILTALVSKGILEKDIRTKHYSLGWALVRYAKNVRSAEDEKYNLKPINQIMQSLSATLGETITLATCTSTRIILIKVIEGSNPLRHCSEEGKSMPLHASAPSKMFIAYMPDKLRARFLKSMTFEKYADKTITDMPSFLKELEQVRATGLAFCKNELTPYCLAISVPIFNKNGEILFALTAVGYIERLNQVYDLVVEKLREAAASIEAVLDTPSGFIMRIKDGNSFLFQAARLNRRDNP